MNTSYELIERYIHGTLTPEEYDRFERMLASDPRLAEQVRIEQSLMSAATKESVALAAAAGGTVAPGPALLAQLQVTPAPAVLAGTVAAGGKAALLLGNPWIVNVLAGVALAGAVTGVFFIAPLLRQPPDKHIPAVQRDTVYVPMSVPAGPALPAVQPERVAPPEPVRRPATASGAGEHSLPAVRKSGTEERQDIRETEQQAKEEATLRELLEREENKKPPEVRRIDSVHMNIRIEK